MANMSFDFIDLGRFFKRLGSGQAVNGDALPTRVKTRMLKAAGKVYIKGIQETTESELHGKYYKGDLKRLVMYKKGKKPGEAFVTWPSEVIHKTNAKANEVAFINEYGAPQRKIAARPFIEKARDAKEDEAYNAVLDVLDDFLKTL